MSRVVQKGTKQVRPLLSLDVFEARRRAINLYRAWYRQLPYIVRQYDIPKSFDQCKERLREEFYKHESVKDVRVIDMLVVKGQMELQESVEIWKQKGHIMDYFRPTQEPKPKDFLGKFLQGIN